MPLNMGQIFGESHLTRAASFNYLGDIRSGLRPVHLLTFSYMDLDRIISFPEKAKLEDFGKTKRNEDLFTKLIEQGKTMEVEDRESTRY